MDNSLMDDLCLKVRDSLLPLLNTEISALSALDDEKLLQRKREFEESLVTLKNSEYDKEDAYLFLEHGVKEVFLTCQIKYCNQRFASIAMNSEVPQLSCSNEKENIEKSVNNENIPPEEEEEKLQEWVNVVEGEWKQGTAGGCLNEATWRQNEQFFLKVEQSGTVELTLEQEGEDEIHPIGFYIFEGVDNKKIVISPNTRAKSAFKRAQSVTCSFECEPNPNGYVRYLIQDNDDGDNRF